ncbi:MAG: hypothetical protein IIT53_12005 [Fibrobacter sp.]|nr:hypothetical protein [Fibrobacter sp.]
MQKTSTYYLCKDEDWIKMKLDEEELLSSSSKAKSSSSQKLSSSSVVKSSSSQALSSSSVEVSSSSQEISSSSKAKSSSSAQNSAFMSEVYDCNQYKCVTTDYLNKDMLDSGLYGQFLDVHDSQVYRTVTIGTQTWMAQNLNYKTELSECYGAKIIIAKNMDAFTTRKKRWMLALRDGICLATKNGMFWVIMRIV